MFIFLMKEENVNNTMGIDYMRTIIFRQSQRKHLQIFIMCFHGRNSEQGPL